MPITNGDAMPSISENALDYTKALEVLKNEYPERDGIDVKTLIDSAKNGGLTYNDFLMLPGYIGTYTAATAHPTLYISLPVRKRKLVLKEILREGLSYMTPSVADQRRLPRCRCCPRHPRHEAHYSQDTLCLLAHGHCDGT
jgi:hypothetical protein